MMIGCWTLGMSAWQRERSGGIHRRLVLPELTLIVGRDVNGKQSKDIASVEHHRGKTKFLYH